MKKRFLSILACVAIIATSTTFTSCGDDDNVTTGNNGGNNGNTTGNILSGSITGNKTLTKSEYTLAGTLLVEDGGTLTIPAGTTIKAKKGFSNYILVLSGGKININGTAEKPVTMTADVDNPTPSKGYWGGLIINGSAKVSGIDENAVGATEVNSAYKYGGKGDADGSGSIKYLKIMHSGARSSGDVEHNGLTLNAVSKATTIENIYVYECADDGVEFFGGDVNVKNFLAVNTDDDMFDITQGYSGTLENAYGIWEKGYTSTEKDPRGIESDGNLDGLNPDHKNQSNFTIKNVTIDLRLDYDSKNNYMHDAIKVRRGATATIQNALVTGNGAVKDLVDLTDKKGNAKEATISVTNKLVAPKGSSNPFGAAGNPADGNKGADKGVFAWTGYKF